MYVYIIHIYCIKGCISAQIVFSNNLIFIKIFVLKIKIKIFKNDIKYLEFMIFRFTFNINN